MKPASSHNLHPDSLEAYRYNRNKRLLDAIKTGLELAFLCLLLTTGWSKSLREVCVHIIGAHYFLQLLLYVVVFECLGKLAGLGIEFCEFRLEFSHKLSIQSAGSWLKDMSKEWSIRVGFIAVLALVIYKSILVSPSYWWIIAWLCFVASYLFLTLVAPLVLFPLFYQFIPLRDEELIGRLLQLSKRAGTTIQGIYEWKLSEKSNRANAALTGLANTRRILLSDTLLQEYDRDEIEAVLAHELGHHVHRHIFKRILLQSALALAGFGIANRALVYVTQHLHMFVSLSDFANLPLLVLVSTVCSIVFAPASNAYSRFHERQADQYSWRALPSVAPFITAMERMSRQNLGEHNPSRIVEALFLDHPSVSRRIAAAKLWEQQKMRSLANS